MEKHDITILSNKVILEYCKQNNEYRAVYKLNTKHQRFPNTKNRHSLRIDVKPDEVIKNEDDFGNIRYTTEYEGEYYRLKVDNKGYFFYYTEYADMDGGEFIYFYASPELDRFTARWEENGESNSIGPINGLETFENILSDLSVFNLISEYAS